MKPADIADVLVVGGGCAALCAAIAARREGATVRMVEHAPAALRGGNARHARNFRLMHDQPEWYVPDVYGEDAFFRDLLRVTGGATDERLARILIRGSATLAPWLVRKWRAAAGPFQRSDALLPAHRFFPWRRQGDDQRALRHRVKLGVSINMTAKSWRSASATTGIARPISGMTAGSNAPSAKTIVVCSGGHQANLGWLRENFRARRRQFHDPRHAL